MEFYYWEDLIIDKKIFLENMWKCKVGIQTERKICNLYEKKLQ